MTTSETDNLPSGGTESAHPSTADTSDDWNYYDPDEDTVETPEQAETETEEDTADEAESAQPDDDEDGQSDDPEADEAEGEETPGVKDDVTITMQDGTKLPVSELKNGYLRQADYSRKTVEIANERKSLTAQSDRISRTVEKFAEFIANQIPAEPPVQLSMTNPQAYIQQKAAYDATMAQVNALIELGQEQAEVRQEVASGATREVLERENQALISTFPETKNPEKRKVFFDTAFNAAREVGYSDEETKSVTDHRMFALAYWAKKGMEAEKSKATAKAKVKDVPPIAAPRRPKGQGNGARNAEAMKRLSKTGSIHDAVAIDFE